MASLNLTPRPRGLFCLSAALAVTLHMTGCLFEPPPSYLVGPDGPPSATVEPAPLSSGVVVNPLLALRFDRQLDPFAVTPPSSVRLTSGGRQVELQVWWDPVDRAVYAEPTTELKPGVRYVFEVVDAGSLPDLAGRVLAASAVEALRSPFTVDHDPAGVRREIPPSPIDEADPEGAFEREVLRGPAACAGCHTAGALYPGTDLALDAEHRSELAGRPARTSPGRTLVIPGQPERSYLLHKMFEDYPGIGGEPMPLGVAMAVEDRRRALRITAAWIRALPSL